MAALDTRETNEDPKSESETNDEIVRQARKRFKRCEDWESTQRKRALADTKFANADPDNGWQWPNDLRTAREADKRPTLTVNEVRQHNLQIINDAAQNKPSVKVRPAGGKASYEAAQVYEGIVRHIEYISKAQQIYQAATRNQVEGGIGYWRVVTDYANDESFDQEIFIRRIKDPTAVYLDPDIQEIDGSDARFGFIFDDMSKEEFDDAYPEFKDKAGRAAIGNAEGWLDENHVRVAEYYRCVPKKDRLVMMKVPETGEVKTVRESQVTKELVTQIIEDPATKHRELVDTEVEWFLIVGETIAEHKIWPGKYIPIVRVIGEEQVIEGKLERKGHTRAMKDTQRMANYWYSSAVEHVALQGKTPWVGPAAAISGYETYWNNANKVNNAFLPFKHVDQNGNAIPPPQRAEPPQMATAYVQGMAIASEKMRSVSGQYESELGMQGNEKSGKAINARQRQGDNATYHYIDNLGIAIGFTGRILIDLIPKVYDTPERMLRILNEDESEAEVMLNPQATQAYLEQKNAEGAVIRRIFNPKLGRYDVMADVGPAYASRREEAFNAYSQILTMQPELTNKVGDLLFKYADFPGADEFSDRLRRDVPPHLLGEAPPPETQQLMEQVKRLQAIVSTVTQEMAEAKLKGARKDADKTVDAYRAETDRLKVFMPSGAVDPQAIAQLVMQTVLEALSTPIQQPADQPDAEAAAAGANGPTPDVPGPIVPMSGNHSEAFRQAVEGAQT